MILSEDDQRRVSAAIKAAEEQTSGEIVCVLVQRSADYYDMGAAVALSAMLTFVSAFLVAFTKLSSLALLGTQLAVIAFLSSQSPNADGFVRAIKTCGAVLVKRFPASDKKGQAAPRLFVLSSSRPRRNVVSGPAATGGYVSCGFRGWGRLLDDGEGGGGDGYGDITYGGGHGGGGDGGGD